MSDIRFVKTGAFYPPEYDVIVDGKRVGRVLKKEEHYNLRRAMTVISWVAYRFTEDSTVRLGSFRTRQAAGEQIAEDVKT